MKIQKNVAGSECELVLTGRIDGKAANELELEVIALTKSPIKSACINLAGADFLCSAAIRVVLQYHRQWKNQGRKLIISRTSPEVWQILELTGLVGVVVEAAGA